MNAFKLEAGLTLLWIGLGLYLFQESAGMLGFIFWVFIGSVLGELVSSYKKSNENEQLLINLKKENEELKLENLSLQESNKSLLESIKPELLTKTSDAEANSIADRIINEVLNKNK